MRHDLAPARTVAGALARHHLTAVLGGSGLLFSLGLVSAVRDWDLMTEASLEQVTRALDGLAWQRVSAGDPPFATEYRLEVSVGDRAVDLIGRFAFTTGSGLCRMPAIPAFTWEGVEVSAPEVWLVAYALMGRTEKAGLLRRWVRERGGADPAVVERLLMEPWPPAIRAEVESWKERNAPGR